MNVKGALLFKIGRMTKAWEGEEEEKEEGRGRKKEKKGKKGRLAKREKEVQSVFLFYFLLSALNQAHPTPPAKLCLILLVKQLQSEKARMGESLTHSVGAKDDSMRFHSHAPVTQPHFFWL